MPLVIFPFRATSMLQQSLPEDFVKLGSTSTANPMARSSLSVRSLITGFCFKAIKNHRHLDFIGLSLMASSASPSSNGHTACFEDLPHFGLGLLWRQNGFWTCSNPSISLWDRCFGADGFGFMPAQGGHRPCPRLPATSSMAAPAIQPHQPFSHIRACGPSLSPDLQSKLATFLQQHGVPADTVSERGKMVTNKLGIASIKEAFEAKNCGAYFKAVASRPSISMRFALPDELSRHVAMTAKHTFWCQQSQRRARRRSLTPKPRSLHSILILNSLCSHTHTNLQDPDGDVVEQIPFAEVEAEASGIAICKSNQVCHFL